MAADQLGIPRNTQTAILPVIVVAELELNSIIPPPDTIEEVKHRVLFQSNRTSLLHITQPNVWTHQEASKETFLRRNGVKSLRLDKPTNSVKLIREFHVIKKSGQWLP